MMVVGGQEEGEEKDGQIDGWMARRRDVQRTPWNVIVEREMEEEMEEGRAGA